MLRIPVIALLLATAGTTFGSTSIAGQVVDQSNGTPVRDATVRLSRVGHSPDDADIRQSNDEGRFLFPNLYAGEWALSVGRSGFAPAAYKATRYAPQGRHITLKPDQELNDVVLRLVPQAVIAGRVLNSEGEPVENAHVVVLLRAGHVNGVPRWTEAASADTLDNGNIAYQDCWQAGIWYGARSPGWSARPPHREMKPATQPPSTPV